MLDPVSLQGKEVSGGGMDGAQWAWGKVGPPGSRHPGYGTVASDLEPLLVSLSNLSLWGQIQGLGSGLRLCLGELVIVG